MDHDGTDEIITDCHISQLHCSSFAVTENIDYEPELENNEIVEEEPVATFLEWRWVQMKSVTRSRTNDRTL